MRPTIYTLGADTGRMSCVRPNCPNCPRTGPKSAAARPTCVAIGEVRPGRRRLPATNGDLRHDTHHQPGAMLVDPPAVSRRTPSRLPARPTNSYQQPVPTGEIVTRDTPQATYPERFPR